MRDPQDAAKRQAIRGKEEQYSGRRNVRQTPRRVREPATNTRPVSSGREEAEVCKNGPEDAGGSPEMIPSGGPATSPTVS